jgi:hypothetical protein
MVIRNVSHFGITMPAKDNAMQMPTDHITVYRTGVAMEDTVVPD